MRISPRAHFQFTAALMTKFLSVWSLDGEASLNLTTRNGNLNMSFYFSRGHSRAPFFLPSTTFLHAHRGDGVKEEGWENGGGLERLIDFRKKFGVKGIIVTSN